MKKKSDYGWKNLPNGWKFWIKKNPNNVLRKKGKKTESSRSNFSKLELEPEQDFYFYFLKIGVKN
jgi:hypothetical protein